MWIKQPLPYNIISTVASNLNLFFNTKHAALVEKDIYTE